MTAPLRWPDRAEEARTNSMSNARSIRGIALEIENNTRDIELMRKLIQIIELTHKIEMDLHSVGAKAEKEKSNGI